MLLGRIPHGGYEVAFHWLVRFDLSCVNRRDQSLFFLYRQKRKSDEVNGEDSTEQKEQNGQSEQNGEKEAKKEKEEEVDEEDDVTEVSGPLRCLMEAGVATQNETF